MLTSGQGGGDGGVVVGEGLPGVRIAYGFGHSGKHATTRRRVTGPRNTRGPTSLSNPQHQL